MVNLKQALVIASTVAGCFGVGIAPPDRKAGPLAAERKQYTVCVTGCDYTGIQAAIDAAAPGDTVLVKPGLYKERISLPKEIVLTSDDADPRAVETTVIDGGSDQVTTGSVASISGNATLHGFTIMGGNATYGGGINVSGYGTIENNIIRGNQASQSGGGIWIGSNAAAKIVGNTLQGNSANARGGAIAFSNNSYSSITISKNLMFENRADSGGAIYSGDYPSSILIDNNVIARNTAKYGGGIYITDYAYTKVINNTIAYNVAENSGGIYVVEYSAATVYNSIIWGNVGGDINPVFYKFSINYSVFKGNGTASNIHTDPLFVDAENLNLSLKGGSPAIDAGQNTVNLPISTDILDVARPKDGRSDGAGPTGDGSDYDIGAYEYVTPPTVNIKTPAPGAAIECVPLSTYAPDIDVTHWQDLDAQRTQRFRIVGTGIANTSFQRVAATADLCSLDSGSYRLTVELLERTGKVSQYGASVDFSVQRLQSKIGIDHPRPDTLYRLLRNTDLPVRLSLTNWPTCTQDTAYEWKINDGAWTARQCDSPLGEFYISQDLLIDKQQNILAIKHEALSLHETATFGVTLVQPGIAISNPNDESVYDPRFDLSVLFSVSDSDVLTQDDHLVGFVDNGEIARLTSDQLIGGLGRLVVPASLLSTLDHDPTLQVELRHKTNPVSASAPIVIRLGRPSQAAGNPAGGGGMLAVDAGLLLLLLRLRGRRADL